MLGISATSQLALDQFPGGGSGPTPPPTPTRPQATQVVVVDAAYGSDDVTRGPIILDRSSPIAGNPTFLAVAVPVTLDADQVNFFFVKPDGTPYNVIGSTFSYVGSVDMPTGLGIFLKQKWAGYNFDAGEIDQFGTWLVEVGQDEFLSVQKSFVINRSAAPIIITVEVGLVDLFGNALVDRNNNFLVEQIDIPT